jgi:hypothetical protein
MTASDGKGAGPYSRRTAEGGRNPAVSRTEKARRARCRRAFYRSLARSDFAMRSWSLPFVATKGLITFLANGGCRPEAVIRSHKKSVRAEPFDCLLAAVAQDKLHLSMQSKPTAERSEARCLRCRSGEGVDTLSPNGKGARAGEEWQLSTPPSPFRRSRLQQAWQLSGEQGAHRASTLAHLGHHRLVAPRWIGHLVAASDDCPHTRIGRPCPTPFPRTAAPC